MSSHPGRSSTSSQKVESVLQKYSRACQAATGEQEWPEIESSLAEIELLVRAPLIKELLQIDIHYRQQKQLSIDFNHYRSRIPEISEEWLRQQLARSVEATGPYVAKEQSPSPLPPILRDIPVKLKDPVSSYDLPLTTGDSLEVPVPEELPDRYQVAGEIDRGGMGAILLGEDRILGRDVAVKILLQQHSENRELCRRFVEEARISGQLQHPGIVPVYDFGQTEPYRPWFAMKLVKGSNLAQLLKDRKSPRDELPRFLGIFEQICQTVAYAHACGVIHRDLKPSNIMIGTFGEVQVMDWGLGRLMKQELDPEVVELGPSSIPTDRTQPGRAMGTFAYMPPEQASGRIDQLDERCDVFGLGAMLCVILTGAPPYTGTDQAIRSQSVAGDLRLALARLEECEIDPQLLDLAKRCLAPGKEDRPRTAGEVSDAISGYLESVQERSLQSELEKARAQARAEEERKRRKLEEAARKQAQEARDQLQMALTLQVVERLESNLKQLEMIAQAIEAILAAQEEWHETEIVDSLKAILRRENRIFGIAIALEPNELSEALLQQNSESPSTQSGYGLYLFRSPEEIQIEHLHLQGYDYRSKDWYREPFDQGRAFWTPIPSSDPEPNPWESEALIAFLLPLRKKNGGRGEEAIGVLTIDLSIKHFFEQGKMKNWLQDLNFGSRSYGFVVCNSQRDWNNKSNKQKGIFISHPATHPDFHYPHSMMDLRSADPAFYQMAQRILSGETGRASARDPATGKPSSFLFAPVPSAEWTFVAVIEESELPEPGSLPPGE